VSAVATDEPSVLISDHRPEIDTRHAMGAADGQYCVCRHGTLPHLNKESWHAGFQTPHPVIPLKLKDRWEPTPVSSRNPRRDSGRRADRRANQADNGRPRALFSVGVKKTKAPRRRLENRGTVIRTALPRSLLTTMVLICTAAMALNLPVIHLAASTHHRRSSHFIERDRLPIPFTPRRKMSFSTAIPTGTARSCGLR